MLENRLCLNKRTIYELPDEVVVGEYRKNYKTPAFSPDLCIGNFGIGCTGKIYKPCDVSRQIWIKTDNEDLINFIKKYNFKLSGDTATSTRGLKLMDFKKIILEEFYDKKV